MALSTFFNEPFYSLADFDRLFDEAFSARTTGGPRNDRQLQQQDVSQRSLRPRYVSRALTTYTQALTPD